MQQFHRLLLLFGERLVHRKIPGNAQLVDLIGGTLFQPVLRPVETVGKLFILIGRADLFKHGLQHGNIEIHHRTQLHQQAHGNRFHPAVADGGIEHNGFDILVRAAVAHRVVHFIEFKILPQNAVVKAEVKRLERLGLGIQPENDFGLIDFQQGVGREIQPRRTRHLAGGALDADEFIALENRRFIIKDRLGNLLAGIVAAVDGGMILSARLKVHAFKLPAHRPVDLPRELAVMLGTEIEGGVMTADAFILGGHGILVKRCNFCGILAAGVAVDTHGEICFAFSFLRVLRAVAVEDIEDFASVAEGMKDVFGILPAAVHLRLIAVIHLNAEFVNRRHEFLLEEFSVGLGVGIREGVLHICVGHTDIFFKIPVHLGDIDGHLSQTVEFVPRKKQSRFFASCPQCPHHKITGGNITEIADVYRAGGTDARRADIFFLFRVTRDNALCDFF